MGELELEETRRALEDSKSIQLKKRIISSNFLYTYWLRYVLLTRFRKPGHVGVNQP